MTLIEFVEWAGNLNIVVVVALWWGLTVLVAFAGGFMRGFFSSFCGYLIMWRAGMALRRELQQLESEDE